MQTKPLEPGVEITSALAVDELEEVKARGFHAVVCHRIEGESEDFPDEAGFREKARQLGLAWVHIPVKPGEYSKADIHAFAEALQQLPRPLLAFCRTGKRATHLWAFAKRQHEQCDLAVLFAAAHAAGIDLEDQRHTLHAIAQ
ncbi:TIGR01244 family phosphatase [Lactobacillus equicursoris]|uniref:TIGR01244 family phosphatase n=1 Tax=Lactobacillus equicursoris TaxID=420645 RepID=A0A844FQQ8_9LACO|nr:TIGR01244 family phosphatase [Lactobacillus equicursoris]